MLKHISIQYDISRGRIPKPSTIHRRLELLQPWGVNALILYIECVVETETFPAVGCGATPVTKSYLRELDSWCRQRGIDLIPMVQILGHQEKLLALDAFEHLGEIPPPRNKTTGMNNFMPHVPEVRQAVKRWLDELLPCFSSPYVHTGCDETYTLGTGRSREHIERNGVEATLADYLSDFQRFLADRGKRMMMAPDMVTHYPALRDLLSQEIIITNWGYGRWDDAYEKDNHHFAMHDYVTRKCNANWSYSNNMAEYVFLPFQRLVANTGIWLELGRRSKAEGYVISDWGSYYNVNPHVLSLMGDLYVLVHLARERLEIPKFLEVFSQMVLGRTDSRMIRALDLMGHAQMAPSHFEDERLLHMLPIFPSLMLDDPNAGSRSTRRFSCLREEGLVRLEAAMREAVELMRGVDGSGAPMPDYLDDLKMLSRRLLMVALRAWLGFWDAWDTGCIWHNDLTLASRRKVLDEYVTLSEEDEKWYMRRWDDENLESDKAVCQRALTQAREGMRRRILSAPVTNTMSFHPPKPAAEG